MNHEIINALLFKAHDKELSPDTLAQIQEHLTSCSQCRTEVEEWDKLSSALHKIPASKAPAHFTNAVMARLENEEIKTTSPWTWNFNFNFRFPSLTLAAAAIVMAFVLVPQLRQPEKPTVITTQEPEFSSELMEISFVPHAEDESNLGTKIEEYFL